MSSRMLPEILKLSVDDRLALADAIYASVDDIPVKREIERQKREDTAMLPGQRAELERRIKKYEAHPELLVPAEKVLAKLKRAR